MLLFKRSLVWLFLAASLLALFALALPLPVPPQRSRWMARLTGTRRPAASTDQGHAAALGSTASSGSRSHILFPGTAVPDDVMRYLIEERHGVDRRFNALMYANHPQATMLDKLHEVLLNPRTKVSPFTYEGTTYFLTPAIPYPDTRYPGWNALLTKPPGVPDRAALPVFVSKIKPEAFRDGRWIEERPYELLAIRTPASVKSYNYLVDRFMRGRHLISYQDLLSQVSRRL